MARNISQVHQNDKWNKVVLAYGLKKSQFDHFGLIWKDDLSLFFGCIYLWYHSGNDKKSTEGLAKVISAIVLFKKKKELRHLHTSSE